MIQQGKQTVSGLTACRRGKPDLKSQENCTEIREQRQNMISADESRQNGKMIRQVCKRRSHGNWEYTRDRDHIIELLKEQERTRIRELIPIRHERMSASPFAFYRGAAIVMADDLSRTPRTGITVQACGDAHIANFGAFASPERRLIFDINDFDETLPGPWEWDVKRLMTSVEICGRHRGFSENDRAQAVLAAAKIYRRAMQHFSETGNMSMWYEHIDLEKLYKVHEGELGTQKARTIHKAAVKTLSKTNEAAFSKLTEVVDGRIQIRSDPPLIVPLRDMQGYAENENADKTERIIRDALQAYRCSLPRERRILIDRYRVVDIARKVVGVGSVGNRSLIVVMEGVSENDPLVLQVKEAQASVLENYLGKSMFAEHGRRVIEGQRAIQTAGDILLGWARVQETDGVQRDYYVRQLWDSKGSVNLEKVSPDELSAIASMCAWTLAHAHAKTGDRHGIAGYLGQSKAFEEAMLRFARSYADQNERDYEVFCRGIVRDL